jgi:thioredoxin 1
MMAAELPEMTAARFDEEVLQSELPVLIDFTAEWCAPCKMLDPLVAELAEEWQGKAKVFQMDADKNTDLLVQWRIMGVPTLALFKDGKIVARMTGYKPKKAIVKKFGKHLP